MRGYADRVRPAMRLFNCRARADRQVSNFTSDTLHVGVINENPGN